jgi:hypothetical protein
VVLFSEKHLKPSDRFFISYYHFYRTDSEPGLKGGTAVAVRKGIPHTHVDLPPLVSIEKTNVCIPRENSKILLSAVYESLDHAWSDANVTEMLVLYWQMT